MITPPKVIVHLCYTSLPFAFHTAYLTCLLQISTSWIMDLSEWGMHRKIEIKEDNKPYLDVPLLFNDVRLVHFPCFYLCFLLYLQQSLHCYTCWLPRSIKHKQKTSTCRIYSMFYMTVEFASWRWFVHYENVTTKKHEAKMIAASLFLLFHFFTLYAFCY